MTLRKLLQANKKQFLFYMIGAFLTTISGIFMTLALSNAFGIIEETETQRVYTRILFVVIFAFTPIFTQILSRFLRIGFMRDILIQVRTLAYEKLMSHNYESFKKKSKENYMSMLISDINLFERDFFLSLLNIIYSFGTFIIGFFILLFIQPTVAFSTFGATLLLFIVTKSFEPVARKAKRQTQDANANYNTQLTNILNGLEVITLYQASEYFKRPFESIVIVLEQIKKRAFRIDEFQSNLNQWIASSYQIIVYVYATYLYILDQITLTSLIIVFNLVGQLIWSMISGFSFINRFKTSSDIFDRITTKENNIDGKHPMSFNHGYSVSNLSFAYDQKLVLKDMSFTIKPKEKVLIIGPSGAGKTTLLSILTKDISSYQGSVTIDDVQINDIEYNNFLQHCGYIRQHHFIFNDSIKNNIILNQPYDQHKLENILKNVDLLDWINTLPERFDHILQEDGANISGGQRQRLSIARELYHNKQILFVDEPSASLDDATSQKIYDALFNLDQTIVCVSHRHIDYLKQQVDQVIECVPLGAKS